MKYGKLIFKEKINQIKPLNKIENIKSKYILKIVSNNLMKKKLLDITKYNNYIKKRIDININNYKEYSEKFSSVEIEIKPVNKNYGLFVNVKKEDEKYYHIYFNNS